ncbi:MAG TPA: hypothetical protein VLK65_06895 [Vicinamibacteria bacterium]|nr:hypothetical protein [Vicinamibacteria bacterium]
MIAFLIYFMRQMQRSPEASSSVTSLSMQKEKRLEIKARVLHVFAAGENELSKEQLLSLVDDAATEANKAEFRKPCTKW